MIFPRKNMRLKGFNYSSSGFYFVTICVKSVETPLAVVDGAEDVLSNTPTVVPLVLTDIGLVVLDIIKAIPDHSEDVIVSNFVIMPDHIHLLLQFKDLAKKENTVQINEKPYYSKISPSKRSLGVVVRQFKSAVTGNLRKQENYNFKWQRNYYDHIVKNDEELERIRKYIKNNPQKLLEAQIKENQISPK